MTRRDRQQAQALTPFGALGLAPALSPVVSSYYTAFRGLVFGYLDGAVCGSRGDNTEGGLSGKQVPELPSLTQSGVRGSPQGHCTRGRGGPGGSREPVLSPSEEGKWLPTGFSSGFIWSWP